MKQVLIVFHLRESSEPEAEGQPALRQRLDEWRKLADVQTWPAQPVFFWEASADE